MVLTVHVDKSGRDDWPIGVKIGFGIEALVRAIVQHPCQKQRDRGHDSRTHVEKAHHCFKTELKEVADARVPLLLRRLAVEVKDAVRQALFIEPATLRDAHLKIFLTPLNH